MNKSILLLLFSESESGLPIKGSMIEKQSLNPLVSNAIGFGICLENI